MTILKYSFDLKSKELGSFAESIHRKYGIESYRDDFTESPYFSHEYVALVLWRRSDSESSERGFVLGVRESYDIVNACGEPLKMVSLHSEKYSATLWVNENDIIRGFVFCDSPALLAFQSELGGIE